MYGSGKENTINTLKSKIMSKFLYLLIVFAFMSINFKAQSIDCNKNYLQYEKIYNAKDYAAAYPLWKKELEECPSYVVNIYNHASELLPALIEKSSGAQKETYVNDLMEAYKKRLQYFPQDKNMQEGDYISYQIAYGKIDSLQGHNELKKIFSNAMQNNTKLTFYTINTFFNNALTLYYYHKISDDEYVTVYDNVKSAIQVNIDIRNREKAPIEDKLYGKEDADGNVVVQPTKLTYQEEQIRNNDLANIEYFRKYDSIYDVYFNQYLDLNCNNLSRIVSQGFDSNKNNKDWVLKYYYLMQDKDCSTPEFAKIESQINVLYPPGQAVASNGGSSNSGRAAPSSNAIEGQRMYKSGNFSGAIPKLQAAIDETSNNGNKASYAALIANSYGRMNSYANAKTWAYKALSYKPGYSTAYLILADIYYRGAAQVPGDAFAQRAAGWAAGDMARRAGDSRRAAQYDASAPSSQECFVKGISAGSPYKVGGWIGTTTTAKCVKR